MARLDRPLYGDSATGTFARVLAFRETTSYPSVAKRPGRKYPASPAQAAQRQAYAAACLAWDALTAAEKSQYKTDAPEGLSGFNYFMSISLGG